MQKIVKKVIFKAAFSLFIFTSFANADLTFHSSLELACEFYLEHGEDFSTPYVNQRIAGIEKRLESYEKRLIYLPEARFRKIPKKDERVSTAKKILPKSDAYNPQSEILINVRQQEGHVSMIVGNWRFDGMYDGIPSSPAWEGDLLEEGMLIRIRNIPEKYILELKNILSSGLQIRDINCFAALYQLFIRFSSLNFNTHPSFGPPLPSELIEMFLQSQLVGPEGEKFQVDIYSLYGKGVNFKSFMINLITREHKQLENSLPDKLIKLMHSDPDIRNNYWKYFYLN